MLTRLTTVIMSLHKTYNHSVYTLSLQNVLCKINLSEIGYMGEKSQENGYIEWENIILSGKGKHKKE